MKTFIKIGKWIIIVLVAIIVIGIVGAALTDKDSEETQPEATQSDEFTVEHDQEYLDTREYIWNFLIEKGYEVQTTAGVPNIGKTDAELEEGSEGWYAFLKEDGEWKEFSIVLFNGEVSAIRPVN